MRYPLKRYYVIIVLNAGAEQGDRHGPLCHLTRSLHFIYLPVSYDYSQHVCTGYRSDNENDEWLVYQINDQ